MTAFLRSRRRRMGLSLDRLAVQTGITKSYLSKIERGISTPSIAVAMRIAHALDADVGQLFSDRIDGEAMVVTRGHGLATVRRQPNSSSDYELIAPDMVGKAMHPFVVYPSASPKSTFVDHAGEEFLFVHAGTIDFEIPGRVTRLEAGDSVYFDASTPHRMRSVSDSDAVVVVIVYDRAANESPEGTALEAHHR